MSAALLAAAVLVQRIGTGPIASAADLERATVAVDAAHASAREIADAMSAALGVSIALDERFGAGDRLPHVTLIAHSMGAAEVLGLVSGQTHTWLELGWDGSARLVAPPEAHLGASGVGASRATASRSSATGTMAIDFENATVADAGAALGRAIGARVVVSPDVASRRLTLHATGITFAMLEDALRTQSAVRLEESAGGIPSIALWLDRGLFRGGPGAIVSEAGIVAPDAATAETLASVLSRYQTRFGSIERHGFALRVVDSIDSVGGAQMCADAFLDPH